MSNITPETAKFFSDNNKKDDFVEGTNPMLPKNGKKNVNKGYMSTFGFGKKKEIDNDGLKNLEEKIETIKGINDNVDVIRGNIQALMDIIANIYELSRENNANNNAQIEALTAKANEIATNLNSALIGLSENTSSLADTSGRNVDEQGEAYTKEKGDKTVAKEKKINKAPIKQKKEGGNPYKTAKKQLTNLISNMIPSSSKTQKKHRKH
jgi:hypothetical protein